MGFSPDENLLNGINLDSITEMYDFMKQLRPILLGEEGYKQVTTSTGLGKNTSELNEIINQRSAGVPESEIAKQLGVSLTEFKRIDSRLRENNALYDKGQRLREQAERQRDPNRKKEMMDQAVAIFEQSNAIAQEIQNFQVSKTSLEKTDDRKSIESRFKALQDKELARLEEEVAFWESGEGKNLRDQQRGLVSQQNELLKKQLERQDKAVSSTDIPVSEVLKKQIQDEFNRFKEAQARNGNVILGDDPTTAVAKGSAAQQALGVFQDNSKAAIQREREAVIQGEGALVQNGLNLSSGLTSGMLDFAQPGMFAGEAYRRSTSLPTQPNFGAVPGITGSAMQPYQFQNQLQFNYDQLRSQRRGGSGKSGLFGALGGAAIGGLVGGPMGASVGSQLGGAAGTLFF